VIHIFHLRLSESGPAGGAPVNGFEPFVYGAGPDELPEFPNDGGLVGFVHGQVRGVPFAENAEALEFLPLDPDEFLRVLPAPFANLRDIHGFLLRAQFLVDLMFYGQAVAIPSRYKD